jgi:hypothetical protein
MASHFRCVGWIRSCSESPRSETGDNSARHRSPQVEWNRSRPADTTRSPSSKIIFLSQNSNLDIVRVALGTGTCGYVRKTDVKRELLPAMDAVLQGKQFVSSSLKDHQFTDTSAEKAAHRHEVQFYSDDALLLDTFARFIAVALKSGRAAIVIITDSHRDGLVSRLKAQGLDVDAATQQGTYLQLDVNKTFSTFMVNDMPDSARFFPLVDGLIEAAAKAARQEHHGVVVCGEGTSVLWEVRPTLRFGLNNSGTR